MRQLKVLLYSGIGFALLFSGSSLILYFGDWSRFFLVCFFGLFVGFLAAPEFEPKAFKKAWAIQLICGAMAGAIAGVVFGLDSADIISTSIIGGCIGWSANLWIKHVPIP